MSNASAGADYAGHLLAHGHDGAGDLVYRFAAHAQAHQHGPDLRGRCLSGHDDVERLARFLDAQRFCIGNLGDERFQVSHYTCSVTSPAARPAS
jgi:hypothetical protein